MPLPHALEGVTVIFPVPAPTVTVIELVVVPPVAVVLPDKMLKLVITLQKRLSS